MSVNYTFEGAVAVMSLRMPVGLEIAETGSRILMPDFSSQFWFQL